MNYVNVCACKWPRVSKEPFGFWYISQATSTYSVFHYIIYNDIILIYVFHKRRADFVLIFTEICWRVPGVPLSPSVTALANVSSLTFRCFLECWHWSLISELNYCIQSRAGTFSTLVYNSLLSGRLRQMQFIVNFIDHQLHMWANCVTFTSVAHPHVVPNPLHFCSFLKLKWRYF